MFNIDFVFFRNVHGKTHSHFEKLELKLLVEIAAAVQQQPSDLAVLDCEHDCFVVSTLFDKHVFLVFFTILCACVQNLHCFFQCLFCEFVNTDVLTKTLDLVVFMTAGMLC